MVFQDLALFPHMTVAKNIEFAIKHMPRVDRKTRIDEVLQLVRLTTKRDHYPHTLSGGQQQRVAVARALVNRPPLILAHEPTGNLDETTADAVFDALLAQTRTTGAGLLLVTHSQRLAARAGVRAGTHDIGEPTCANASFATSVARPARPPPNTPS